MSSIWGNKVKISIFGESHGEGIGVVLDSLPAGYTLDWNGILEQMARRAPGQGKFSTPRKEADTPKVLSGLLEGVTTGAPLCAVIENTNTKSQDYQNLMTLPRPSHADYPAYVKYKGFNDVRGGGHYSGRLTAPMVFAGAVCRQILETKGIVIGGHVASIGEIEDARFDLNDISELTLKELNRVSFATLDVNAQSAMLERIEQARKNGDSVGGTIECAAIHLPVGLGSNIFSTVEGRLSSILFGIPAVKGVEFGAGFGISAMSGSQANDPYGVRNDKVVTLSNNNGGILGGMTTGAPLVFRVALKPTSSISKMQKTVHLQTGEEADLVVKGRHDPCVVPRALPVVEAASAIALLDLMAEEGLV